MFTRREVLRSTAAGTALGVGVLGSSGTVSSVGAGFGDGVNLQPSYFCSGDQDLGWDLMDAAPDIQTVRIEIEPPSMGESQATMADARRWLEEADSRGYEVIATYHHHPHNGSPDPETLLTAAGWWVENYAFLSENASFTINLMNEWGNHDVTASTYADAYQDAISTVRRQTSYTGPIVCDAPGWGQGTHRLADAAQMLAEDNLILSAHVYPSGWNATTGETFQASHLDVLDETGYPCIVGEFGSKVDGDADWSGMVDHAKELGWPVIGWAWNGDGGGMNMADPYWGDQCPSSYTRSSYFDTIYAKLDGDSGQDTQAPTAPTDLSAYRVAPTVFNVSWSASTDSGGSGLQNYRLYVDDELEETAGPDVLEADVSGVPDTTYEIAVEAVDGAGNASDRTRSSFYMPPDTETPSGCEAPTAPSWSDGTTPADVDADGVYEDFNGNCEFDSDDVVTYFQEIDRSGIQTNPSYYDANGNGNADFDDIVTLFQQL